jgi:hypothetical protein
MYRLSVMSVMMSGLIVSAVLVVAVAAAVVVECHFDRYFAAILFCCSNDP